MSKASSHWATKFDSSGPDRPTCSAIFRHASCLSEESAVPGPAAQCVATNSATLNEGISCAWCRLSEAGRLVWRRTLIVRPAHWLCRHSHPFARSRRSPDVPIRSPHVNLAPSADHLIELPSTASFQTRTKSSTRPAPGSARLTPSNAVVPPRRSSLKESRIRSVATLSWYPYPHRARHSPMAGASRSGDFDGPLTTQYDRSDLHTQLRIDRNAGSGSLPHSDTLRFAGSGNSGTENSGNSGTL